MTEDFRDPVQDIVGLSGAKEHPPGRVLRIHQAPDRLFAERKARARAFPVEHLDALLGTLVAPLDPATDTSQGALVRMVLRREVRRERSDLVERDLEHFRNSCVGFLHDAATPLGFRFVTKRRDRAGVGGR